MPLDGEGPIPGPQAPMLVLKVYLDGEQKTHVVGFDTKAGTMRRIKTDDSGKPTVESEGPNAGIIQFEDLTGDVSATFGVAD